MPVYCSVPQCKTKDTNGMHRFPTDADLKRKWMDATRTHHLHNSKSCRVCRKHFKETDLLVGTDGKKTLAPNVVLSLWLPLSFSWDHSYHAIGPPKKRRFKRVKAAEVHEASVSDGNIGNEIEVDCGNSDATAKVGSFVDTAYLQALEEKILHQKRVSKPAHLR